MKLKKKLQKALKSKEIEKKNKDQIQNKYKLEDITEFLKAR
jgi:hypothetical protein